MSSASSNEKGTQNPSWKIPPQYILQMPQCNSCIQSISQCILWSERFKLQRHLQIKQVLRYPLVKTITAATKTPAPKAKRLYRRFSDSAWGRRWVAPTYTRAPAENDSRAPRRGWSILLIQGYETYFILRIRFFIAHKSVNEAIK